MVVAWISIGSVHSYALKNNKLLKEACPDPRGRPFFMSCLFPVRQAKNKNNMKYKLTTYSKKLLADTLTPVNIYLKLRDVFAGSILLESSDYHGHENSLSFICCEPLSSFIVTNQKAEIIYPGGVQHDHEITQTGQVTTLLDMFKNSFEVEGP